MTFQVVKRGTRPSDVKIYISKVAKTLALSTGWCRENHMESSRIYYLRMAYNPDSREIALEVVDQVGKNSDEYMKLSWGSGKTSAACSVNPIIASFGINIEEISGTYKGDSIVGPTTIPDFSSKAYILRTKIREV